MKLKEGFEIKESNLKFKLDSEFVNLCNSLLEEELEKLENSIKTEGCRDPLIIWKEKNILLDGHHRLYFCQKYNKPYKIFEHSFLDRFSALLWTWKNDKGRRGSGDSLYYDAETVILKFKEGLEKLAKERQKTSTGGTNPQLLIHGTKAGKSINVRQQLARLAHVSEITINRAKFIMKYADEETKEGLRKRKPKLQFRALAEKHMMLYPEKQDSEKEKKFKENLDKKTILNILPTLPSAQKFIEVMRRHPDISSEHQREAAEKIVEKERFNKIDIERELLGSHLKLKKLNKEEKNFEDFIHECRKSVDKLNQKIEILIQFKEDFDSEYYQKTLERLNFILSLKKLIENSSFLSRRQDYGKKSNSTTKLSEATQKS